MERAVLLQKVLESWRSVASFKTKSPSTVTKYSAIYYQDCVFLPKFGVRSFETFLSIFTRSLLGGPIRSWAIA